MAISSLPSVAQEPPLTARPVLYNRISTVGAFVYAVGILLTVVNVVRSRTHGLPAGPDPWKGNTLEWFVPSPPPPHNFDSIPRVRSVEPMKDIRRQVERQSRTSGSRPAAAAEHTVVGG